MSFKVGGCLLLICWFYKNIASGIYERVCDDRLPRTPSCDQSPPLANSGEAYSTGYILNCWRVVLVATVTNPDPYHQRALCMLKPAQTLAGYT